MDAHRFPTRFPAAWPRHHHASRADAVARVVAPVVNASQLHTNQERPPSRVLRVALGWSIACLCRSFRVKRLWHGPRQVRTQRKVGTDDQDFLESNQRLILTASWVGIITGTAVSLLNVAIHSIQDILFNVSYTYGVEYVWAPIIGALVTCAIVRISGGAGELEGTALPALRSMAKADRVADEVSDSCGLPVADAVLSKVERLKRAVVRAVLAAVSLGTGNSLGPEGPAVELGGNVAAFLGGFGEHADPEKDDQKLVLLASGCAAGIAAGFNAPIAGLFFAVEVVKAPQQEMSESAVSRLLASAFAAAVAQVFLGSSPAVKDIVFSTTGYHPFLELPLYMLLGALCGLASAAMILARSRVAAPFFMALDSWGLPRSQHPLVAGGIMALVGLAGSQELYYQGFDNVNMILSSASKFPSQHLFELLLGKILLTGLCAESGLVGGVFAPAIFIGVTAGALYGQAVEAIALFLGTAPVGNATCFSAVGGASALAGVCGVPLTSVVLLLELTAGIDYNICLPLIAAVGVSVYVEKAIEFGWMSLTLNKMFGEESLDRVAMSTSRKAADGLETLADYDGTEFSCGDMSSLETDTGGAIPRTDLGNYLKKRQKSDEAYKEEASEMSVESVSMSSGNKMSQRTDSGRDQV